MSDDQKNGTSQTASHDPSRRAAMGAGLAAAIAVVAGLATNGASAAPLKKGTQKTLPKTGTQKTFPKTDAKKTLPTAGTKKTFPATGTKKTLPKG